MAVAESLTGPEAGQPDHRAGAAATKINQPPKKPGDTFTMATIIAMRSAVFDKHDWRRKRPGAAMALTSSGVEC